MDRKGINKKKIIVVSVISFLVMVGVIILLVINLNRKIENVKVDNVDFQKIMVSWDLTKGIDNYEIILSNDKYSREDITKDIKDNSLSDNYEIINSDTSGIEIDVLSNMIYYICILGNDSNGKYVIASDVIEIKTDTLEVSPVSDLMVSDSTNEMIKLKWIPFVTDKTNLDGSVIEITYSIYDRDDNLIKDKISENEYEIGDLDSFNEYGYRVVTYVLVDGKIVSVSSDITNVMTKSDPISKVSVKTDGTSVLNITWDKYEMDGISNISYTVYGSDKKDSDFKLLKENIEGNSYKEENLSDNKTRYYYVVCNYDIDGVNYVSSNSEIVSGTTDKKVVTYYSSSNSGSSSSGSSSSSKEAQARVIARQIANSITGSSDLEKVQKAAQAVYDYTLNATYTTKGDDYYTAYGVFIKGEFSCAGTARALGMVLEEMGYKWTHINPNQWTHQWVELEMDGKHGYADAMIAIAGYGEYPSFFW